jgi:hypothetical protein
MGKRSDFERNKLDYYATPLSAVQPLLPHLPPETWYCEPCAGAGVLMAHLKNHGHTCNSAFDVNPQELWIRQHDASFITEEDLGGPKTEMIITNPPWDRTPLHQIIERCSLLRPTWLLFDADWMHTRQSIPYMSICRMIVSVGRVKWIEGSDNTGMDNCCWYLFDQKAAPHKTVFVGRT